MLRQSTLKNSLFQKERGCVLEHEGEVSQFCFEHEATHLKRLPLYAGEAVRQRLLLELYLNI